MFSSLSTTALVFASSLAGKDGIAPDGSEPIGWLAGGFTLVFFIVVYFLIRSFVRTQRRVKEQWDAREAADTSSSNAPAVDEPPSDS